MIENAAVDISSSLAAIGYADYSSSALLNVVKNGIASSEFRGIVLSLCSQLKKFLRLEETVRDSEDTAIFALELAGFLREMNCPVLSLMNAETEGRFLDPFNCMHLLDYLISEIEAVRLIAKSSPEVLKKTSSNLPQLSKSGGDNAFWLQKLCISLGFPKPPRNISGQELCSKVESRVRDVVSSWPPEILSKPLIQCQISSQQWASLLALNEIFTEEYVIRREMLLTRLDVTVRSFGWGDQKKGAEIEKVYLPLRQVMKVRTGLSVVSVLAAREDLIRIHKTCDAYLRERTRCEINKAKMGAVPDRGGRAGEYEPPLPEMPQWQKRQSDGGRGGSRGGHGGGRGGGGGHGNVYDRLDGGSSRPHTAGYGQQDFQGANYQQQYQGDNYYQPQQFQGQQFRPQSNFDMYGGAGGNERQDRSHSGRGRGRRGGRW